MSRRPLRNHSPAFKAKVALDAIRGEKTLAGRTGQATRRAPPGRSQDVQLRPPSDEQRFLRKSLHIAAPVDEMPRGSCRVVRLTRTLNGRLRASISAKRRTAVAAKPPTTGRRRHAVSCRSRSAAPPAAIALLHSEAWFFGTSSYGRRGVYHRKLGTDPASALSLPPEPGR